MSILIAANNLLIFEDFVKAMSSALTVHFESFRLALRTTLFSFQAELSDPEIEFLANELLQLMAVLGAFVVAAIDRMIHPQSQYVIDGEYIKDRMSVFASRASSSIGGYVNIALHLLDGSLDTGVYYTDQIRRAASVLASAPCVLSIPMETMEFFASIMSSRNIGVVTTIEYQKEARTLTIATAATNVRTMILTHYLTNADAIGRVFANLDVTVLPDAMEWIGRDNIGFSVMYNLLRSNPISFIQMMSSKLEQH
jgi:hypothetical protein